MTDPLHDLTDAHLQAALDAVGLSHIEARHIRTGEGDWRNIIAHALTIAANEKKGEAMRLLAAELAEERLQTATFRAKLEAALAGKPEPAPVDPVKVEAHKMARHWMPSQFSTVEMLVEKAIRRGIEMQPAPFTQEEAKRIAKRLSPVVEGGSINDLIFNAIRITLTTPHADLLAISGISS